MKKITFTDKAPATISEANIKKGDTMNVPDMRAAELVGLGWAEYAKGEEPDAVEPTPMYASSNPAPTRTASAPAKPADKN